MPNHETNHVVIIGNPENIAAFIAEGTRDFEDDDNRYGTERPERVLDFDLIVPRPENIEQGRCPHGLADTGPNGEYMDEDGVERICWYRWTTSNWGTKWGVYSHTHFEHRILRDVLDDTYARVDLRFYTAWSQPTPIFKTIEERWGVEVHAITQDEGGFPDKVYGTPYECEVLSREVVISFKSYDRAVEEVPATQSPAPRPQAHTG